MFCFVSEAKMKQLILLFILYLFIFKPNKKKLFKKFFIEQYINVNKTLQSSFSHFIVVLIISIHIFILHLKKKIMNLINKKILFIHFLLFNFIYQSFTTGNNMLFHLLINGTTIIILYKKKIFILLIYVWS